MIKFDQRKIHPEVEEALVYALSRWKGTPYRKGQQRAGAGVDCVRFVCGVYDSLYKVKTPIENLPSDIAFHDPEGARAGMREIIRLYGATPLDRDDFSLEPGDAVITSPKNGGPGHVMIAGPWPTLWHAAPWGVVPTSHSFEGFRFSGIVRPTRKDSWGL